MLFRSARTKAEEALKKYDRESNTIEHDGWIGKSIVEAKSGENVALSIDRNVQSYAEEALKRGIDKAGATEGSVMVMNPNNGQVLAMANYPTYNPAEYTKQKDAAVFSNATTMLPFEPGSIVKTFSMAMGIDNLLHD